MNCQGLFKKSVLKPYSVMMQTPMRGVKRKLRGLKTSTTRQSQTKIRSKRRISKDSKRRLLFKINRKLSDQISLRKKHAQLSQAAFLRTSSRRSDSSRCAKSVTRSISAIMTKAPLTRKCQRGTPKISTSIALKVMLIQLNLV